MEFRLPVGARGAPSSSEVGREQVKNRMRKTLRLYHALGHPSQGTPRVPLYSNMSQREAQDRDP